MKINYCKLGNQIKKYRINRGLTQEQLSECADITSGYLSKIENGFGKPTLDTLLSIAICLDVSIDELIFNDDCTSSYDLISKMILKQLDECSANEKELIYTLTKSFIDYLSLHSIRI